ncbi:MAG: GAF domain-containing protein, partial [Gammaproteobacteria bacterium SHHR-1]
MAISSDTDVNALLSGVLETIQAYVGRQNDHIQSLYRIGAALSSETRLDHLLEMILTEAMGFSNADGGTLYVTSEDARYLHFRVVETRSLGIKMGGAGEAISWPDLPLYKADGEPNREMVAALCALEDRTINIADVYLADERYNFEGTRQFDAKTGYRSRSMLVIPMRNYENQVIGVCQLLNRIDPDSGEVTPFSEEDEKSLLSLASQAAIA